MKQISLEDAKKKIKDSGIPSETIAKVLALKDKLHDSGVHIYQKEGRLRLSRKTEVDNMKDMVGETIDKARASVKKTMNGFEKMLNDIKNKI